MLQKRARSVCTVEIRGVSLLGQEDLSALVVFKAWFGPWVLLPPQDTWAHMGDPPAVGVLSSGSSDLCLLHVLQ